MKPIGVFDSGIGGLTVVKELMQQLPNEDIVYLGDTAHLPYGTKSASTVIKFTLENILFLLKQGVKLIVIACNTASSLALPVIRRHFRIPIIGVIQPGAKEAVYATKTKCVGVIGTAATIKSRAYEIEIRRIDPQIKVISQACPLFVPLVEEGWLNQSVTFSVAREYLAPIKKTHIDTLILGCTHYPLLKSVIKRILGEGITLIDSAKQVVEEVKAVLYNEGLAKAGRAEGKHIFYVTDEPEGFAQQAKRFLGKRLSGVKKVENV